MVVWLVSQLDGCIHLGGLTGLSSEWLGIWRHNCIIGWTVSCMCGCFLLVCQSLIFYWYVSQIRN